MNKKTISRLIDDAAVILQKIRRIEESDNNGYCVCVSCGKKDHWKNMHGGHWISRKKIATKLVRNNINPQCVSCNTFQSDASKPYYSVWMIKKHGQDYIDFLIKESKKTAKYSKIEIETLVGELKKELKELEKRL